MTVGHALAFIVFCGVLLSFVIALPGWVTMAFIGMLAAALLFHGIVIYRHTPGA